MTLSTKASKDPSTLELELERSVDAPSLARAAIVGFSQDSHSSPGTIATVMLLVSETVTNAVIHPVVKPPGKIGLFARLGKEVIRVEVSDDGRGFKPRPRNPGQLGGGFGLYLLEKESARWGIENTPHTKVWFEVAVTTA
ncbi:MAG: ATP-binding protein [Solirubrobacteraceae bacterium]